MDERMMTLVVSVRMELARACGCAVLVSPAEGVLPAAVTEVDAVVADDLPGLRKVLEAAVVPSCPSVVCVGDAVLAVGRTPVELSGRLAALTATGTRAGGAPAGSRLQGRIVIVTGAAQGFGRGIADELVREGAAVVVADLNEEMGRQAVAELEEAAGAGCARFVPMNVASAESCADAVAATVRAFGGVDMLVSNAGVLKAGGIEELDEKAFDLVGDVNYKGYFLSVRAVTPVMRLQHRVHSGWSMDIIQINSKSGLEGSKRNFAYAGSKFGAIGLTQSFALELVEDRIKVNAICPGNYFDGPLWSDPERGLFRQYLDTGKVPGARTLEDVKQFYMSKVPMGRGCTPADVAVAILYLHDQAYETGQALPVTGGQVMLN